METKTLLRAVEITLMEITTGFSLRILLWIQSKME